MNEFEYYIRPKIDTVAGFVGGVAVISTTSLTGGFAAGEFGRLVSRTEWPTFMFIGELVGFLTPIVIATLYSFRQHN